MKKVVSFTLALGAAAVFSVSSFAGCGGCSMGAAKSAEKKAECSQAAAAQCKGSATKDAKAAKACPATKTCPMTAAAGSDAKEKK